MSARLVAKTTSMTSSTTLSGVDAPEVTPMTSVRADEADVVGLHERRRRELVGDGVGVGVQAIARVDPVAGNGFILADLLEVEVLEELKPPMTSMMSGSSSTSLYMAS